MRRLDRFTWLTLGAAGPRHEPDSWCALFRVVMWQRGRCQDRLRSLGKSQVRGIYMAMGQKPNRTPVLKAFHSATNYLDFSHSILAVLSPIPTKTN